MRAALVLAALLMAATGARAEPRAVEGRWCSVYTGFVDTHWDCRYPTLAMCAAAVGTRTDMCLRNPNWGLYRRARFRSAM